MVDLVWLNGTLAPLAEARISPTSAGALYGWGVFTTLGVVGGRARAFDMHWERLAAHAARVGVEIGREPDEVERGIADLLAAGAVVDGRARVSVLRAEAGLWAASGPGVAAAGSDVIVLATRVAPRGARPFALTVSPHRVNTHAPTAGVKCTSYVGQLLALEEARARDFDEAVMLNERGEVAEATAANVFWVRDGELFTPSLATGCLAGVTRRLVLDSASRRRIRVTEGSFPLAALGDADELFVTNSGWGVVPVAQFDLHMYGRAPVAGLLATDVETLLGGPPRS